MTHPDLDRLLLRIRAEFEEMPGLQLTAAQAQRLWGLDRSTCEEVLRRLVDAGVLRQTARGTYMRPDAGSTR